MPSLWKQRTSTEKVLIVALASVIIFATFVTVSFIVLLPRLMTPPRIIVTYVRRTGTELGNEYDISICSTPDCVHTASKLLLNLDENVDPCDDFYDFACGSFTKNTRIPDDRASLDAFSITIDKLQEQLRSLLEEPITSNELRPFMLAKTVYQSCINTTAIESRGTKPFLDLLRSLGGWPVLDGDSWNESNFSWKDSVYRFRKAGHSVDYFLEFSILVDLRNNSKRIIDLDQATLGLNREFLLNRFSDKLVQAYYDYMVDIAILLGAEKIRAEVELKQSLQFEIKLAKISLPKEKRRNTTTFYNPFTIEQLSKQFPSIPWLEYINRMLAPHVAVGAEEIAILNVPKYISDLENLLKVTPRRVLANYVMWRVVKASVPKLTESLRYRQLVYSTVLTGTSEHKSRWMECSDTTNNLMSIAVGALYVRKFFKEKSKAMIVELVNDIRHQFYKILTEVNWMDNQTRNAALDKAESVAFHIAYPEELLDDKKITDYYSGLEVSSGKWLESSLNISLFTTEYWFRQLREPVNKTDWISHGKAVDVNAFYWPDENSMQFPAGILQGVFFSPKRPAYMNYGAIGHIIGHEFTHGFDDKGRQFDKNGNLVDWWQEHSKQLYLKKALCIIDQYSNYTVAKLGLNINGINTQGENIADNGGIKEAYYAYQAWTTRHGDESRLPGFEKYTPKQLFWLSAANIWCSVLRDELLKLMITTDSHAPDRFRVIGPLSNMEELAQDYKCPEGSKMNPRKKCKVW